MSFCSQTTMSMSCLSLHTAVRTPPPRRVAHVTFVQSCCIAGSHRWSGCPHSRTIVIGSCVTRWPNRAIRNAFLNNTRLRAATGRPLERVSQWNEMCPEPRAMPWIGHRQASINVDCQCGGIAWLTSNRGRSWPRPLSHIRLESRRRSMVATTLACTGFPRGILSSRQSVQRRHSGCHSGSFRRFRAAVIV